MFKQSILQEVARILDETTHLFSYQDFEITTDNNSDSDATIYILFNGEYMFFVKYVNGGFIYTFSPGDILETSTGGFDSLPVLYDLIYEWVILIETELNTPSTFHISQRDNINQFFNNQNINFSLDEEFSKQEIDNIHKELNKLKHDLLDDLKKQKLNSDELNSKVKELEEKIKVLKNSINKMSKKNWSQFFVSKFFDVITDSKKIGTAANYISKILNVEITNLLPPPC